MTHPILSGLLLFGVGVLAGTLNVLAGGGSMLTLPIMIFLGLPPTVANGTNRVAILVQNFGAAASFRRRGLTSGSWLRLGVPPALVGVLVGTLLAVRIGDLAFQRVLAFALIAVTGFTLWQRTPSTRAGDAEPPVGPRRWGFAAAFFLLGVYGGFIQAGIGFIILAVTSAGGLDLVRGNAVKVTLVLAFTPVALALFAWNGKVDWAMGFSLAGGNLIGGLVGVRMQVLKGHAWVRGVVTAAMVVFAVRLLWAGQG